MRKFFVFAVVAIIALTAHANNNYTIVPGKVIYQSVINGKVVAITKGDTAVISGVDSIVVIKTDSASASEKVAVYVDGKVKFSPWLKVGYTQTTDPTDTTRQKIIITAVGGDENVPGDLPIGLGWIVLMTVVGSVCLFGLYRWLK